MNEFHRLFYQLPVNIQYHILDELHQALLYRGWDKLRHNANPSHAQRHVVRIAAILHSEGHDIVEYT